MKIPQSFIFEVSALHCRADDTLDSVKDFTLPRSRLIIKTWVDRRCVKKQKDVLLRHFRSRCGTRLSPTHLFSNTICQQAVLTVAILKSLNTLIVGNLLYTTKNRLYVICDYNLPSASFITESFKFSIHNHKFYNKWCLAHY